MAHRDERKRSKHKRSKHKRSKHKKHKHKKHHKKRRKKSKHHRRNRGKARPSGLPSIPTLEQNQYFMMQARVAGREQQLLAAAKESKPEKKSRAEEVDLLNQVLEEQDRQSRGRDRARGSTGLSHEEAREFVKLGAELSRSAPDPFGVEHMGGDDADSSSAERSAARASGSGSPSMWHSMTPVKTEPEPDPFEQAREQERESVTRLTSGELEESTRP